VTDRDDYKRLILQIERAVVARASLRTLLAAADATVAGYRQQLRTIKARLAGRRPLRLRRTR
jgi:hypothetical protein